MRMVASVGRAASSAARYKNLTAFLSLALDIDQYAELRGAAAHIFTSPPQIALATGRALSYEHTMNIAPASPPPPMTVEEYRCWATNSRETKPMCLMGGHVRVMGPRIAKHIEVQGAVYRLLFAGFSRLNEPDRVVGDGVTVRVDRFTAYEPNAFVYRGPRLAPDSLEMPEPVIVVEVLSPGTRRMDLRAKSADYFTLPTVIHCSVIDPDAPSLTHFRRGADGRADLGEPHTAGVVRLDPPDIEIDIAALFSEV